jgi:hypothetical protein
MRLPCAWTWSMPAGLCANSKAATPMEACHLEDLLPDSEVRHVVRDHLDHARDIRADDVGDHGIGLREGQDELYYIVKGSLRIEFENEAIDLDGSQFSYRTKRHSPQSQAREECWVLLIEPASTKNTGEVTTPRTRSLEEKAQQAAVRLSGSRSKRAVAPRPARRRAA